MQLTRQISETLSKQSLEIVPDLSHNLDLSWLENIATSVSFVVFYKSFVNYPRKTPLSRLL